MNPVTLSCATTGNYDAWLPVDALPLGVIVYDDGLQADDLLAQIAALLAAEGYRLGGAVQSSVRRPGRRKCDMYLRDLLGGDRLIWSGELNRVDLDPFTVPARIFRVHARMRREADFDYFM